LIYSFTMNDFWTNFILELVLLTILGVLYYFYQKRKMLRYEENKVPLVMGFILQACLTEKKDTPEPELDTLIESLDDYLQNKTMHPPLALLNVYMKSAVCSVELRDVIREGLIEIEGSEGGQK
jgi:hypothetical protein